MTSVSPKYYSSGDVIIASEPFAHLVSYDCKGEYCDNCLAMNASLKKCAKCEQMFYCDRVCRLSDWKYHKLECDLFAKHALQITQFIESVGENYHLMLMRLFLALKTYPNLETKKYSLHNGSQRCFYDLMSHERELDIDDNREKFLCLMNSFNINISEQEFQRLMGILATNSFCLLQSNLTKQEIGCGLYVSLSVFDHSCQPNAMYVNIGTKMLVKASKSIEPNEQIFISYIPIDMPRSERQSVLRKTKLFVCRCVRCDSDWDSKFDYEGLRQLCDEYEKLNTNRLASDSDVIKRIKLGEQILALKKQLYQCYSSDISCHMFTHAINLIDSTNRVIKCGETRDDIKYFIRLTADNLKITHGVNHRL